MYIIDETYFIKELSVPNLNEMDSDNLTVLEQYIDKYARQFMQNILGYELFKDFDTNKLTAQKWIDLINGKEYTKDGKLVKWKGLIYEDGIYKGSILAKYVFYFWLKDNITTVTATGEKMIEAQNAIAVNSNQRLVSVWNDFVKEYQNTQINNPTIYELNNRTVIDWYGNNDNSFVTLLQFLVDHKEDYPIENYQYFKFQNQFGL